MQKLEDQTRWRGPMLHSDFCGAGSRMFNFRY